MTNLDIRIAHYLASSGASDSAALELLFGRKLRKSLQRLLLAGVIKKSSDNWELRSLAKTFAVKEIIAIEAKMTEWAGAIEQAFLNTWFASSSYVLLPEPKRKPPVFAAAEKSGVRVWTDADAIRRSTADELPKSYASWLFNEWVWRAARPHLGLAD